MKLPGKIQKAESTKDKIIVNDLVCYEHHGALLLAVVTDQAGASKYTVINDRGREQDCPAQRLHKLPKIELPLNDGNEAIGTHLSTQLDAAKALVSAEQLEELWEVVSEDARQYTNSELTQLLFGEDSFEAHLGLRLALMENTTFFKRKKEFFVPRPPETVEELKKAAATQAKKVALRSAFIEWVSNAYKKPCSPQPDIQEFVDLLCMYAASGQLDSGRKKEVAKLFELIEKELGLELPGQRERKAFNLLRKLGVFSEVTKLAVFRHQVPIDFTDELRSEVSCLQNPDASLYKDRTNLECFTIDDEHTKDMDDALSIIKTENGYELGIYISDVAGLVLPDSPLEQEARKRATSLYFHDQTVHMFPENFSEERASLVENEVRPVLACICDIDLEFQVRSVHFELAHIKNHRRYNYEEADEFILHGNSPFDTLYSISTAREMRRFDQGGFRVTKPEIRFTVDERNRVSIHEFYEQSPARNLVGEFMILANEYMARFADEHRLPFIYRTQDAPDSPRPEIPEGLEGPAAQYLQRSGLRPSSTQVAPGPHHMLGLSHYAQATSPIRRFLDLCNQRQIRNFLSQSEVYYTHEQLEDIINEVNAPQKRAGLLIRETHRQMLLTYLWQNRKSISTLKGTVIRTDMKHPLLELDKIYMPYVAKLNTPVAIGDERMFRIKRVDPVLDDFVLEEVTSE